MPEIHWTLTELPSGYLHLRYSSEVWAQWPRGEDGPRPEHCFHPEWSWPILKTWSVLTP